MVDAESIFESASSPKEAYKSFKQSKRAKRKRKKQQKLKQARRRLIRNVVFLGAVAVAVALSLGYVSVAISPVTGAVAFAGGAGLMYALAEHDDEVSITFALSAIAVGALLAEFVAPSWVVDPIAQYIVAPLPMDWATQLDPVSMAVVIGAVIFIWWLIDIRFITRSGVKPDTVAKRLSKRFENLLENWISIGRITVALGLGLVFIGLEQMGMLTGDLVGYASEAPYLAWNLVTIAGGYLALGGDIPYTDGIPFLEAMGATSFAAVALLGLAVVVGVKYAD